MWQSSRWSTTRSANSYIRKTPLSPRISEPDDLLGRCPWCRYLRSDSLQSTSRYKYFIQRSDSLQPVAYRALTRPSQARQRLASTLLARHGRARPGRRRRWSEHVPSVAIPQWRVTAARLDIQAYSPVPIVRNVVVLYSRVRACNIGSVPS